jgi:hypothetical protein
MTSLRKKYEKEFEELRQIETTKGTKSPGNGQTCHNPTETKELETTKGLDPLCTAEIKGQHQVPTLQISFWDLSWSKENFKVVFISENNLNHKIVKVAVNIPRTARKGDWVETNNGRKVTVRTLFSRFISNLYKEIRKKNHDLTPIIEIANEYEAEFWGFKKTPEYMKPVFTFLQESKNNENNKDNNDNENNNNNNDNNNNNNDNDNDNIDNNDNDIDIDIDKELDNIEITN